MDRLDLGVAWGLKDVETLHRVSNTDVLGLIQLGLLVNQIAQPCLIRQALEPRKGALAMERHQQLVDSLLDVEDALLERRGDRVDVSLSSFCIGTVKVGDAALLDEVFVLLELLLGLDVETVQCSWLELSVEVV